MISPDTVAMHRDLEAAEADESSEFREGLRAGIRGARRTINVRRNQIARIDRAEASGKTGRLPSEKRTQLRELWMKFTNEVSAARDFIERAEDMLEALAELDRQFVPYHFRCDGCYKRRYDVIVDEVRYCGRCAEEHGVRPRGKI